MNLKRVLRHLFTDDGAVRRAFPDDAMRRIEERIAGEERRHAGEIRFAVEASLPLNELLAGMSARERAVDWFGRLRVWDTEDNTGVLVYLLLADKSIEIVADRGIHARVGSDAWEAIAASMQRDFAGGQFERGVLAGVTAVGELLAAHFPAVAVNPNELPDRPVIL